MQLRDVRSLCDRCLTKSTKPFLKFLPWPQLIKFRFLVTGLACGPHPILSVTASRIMIPLTIIHCQFRRRHKIHPVYHEELSLA